MSEVLTEQSSDTIAERSVDLYQAENTAKDNFDRGTKILMGEGEDDAQFTEEFGAKEPLGEEETSYDRLVSTVQNVDEQYEAALEESDAFATQHMNELHEAAIKEAAARVADVYAAIDAEEQAA